MKLGFIALFLMIAVSCFGQSNTVDGIVFDKDSQERIATVSIHNLHTGLIVYNNLKGEFKIDAKTGDVLVFARLDYHTDTVKINKEFHLAIYMAPTSIRLREVTIRDTVLSPERRLAETKAEFSKAYGSLSNSDLLSTPSMGSAGLSIDAIYNALSRSGRNAARLRGIIENDFEQNTIDVRFNRTYVGNITGLKDERLTAFMFRYRPGYYTTKTASEYEFIAMILANLRRFLRNEHTYELPKLVTPPVVNQ
ncbi:MAG TPA: hypothetical protein VHA56_07115 [Mucilaginibacter sp.]|nr:hypothetical protein [Mucilaginibacter sp.]